MPLAWKPHKYSCAESHEDVSAEGDTAAHGIVETLDACCNLAPQHPPTRLAQVFPIAAAIVPAMLRCGLTYPTRDILGQTGRSVSVIAWHDPA